MTNDEALFHFNKLPFSKLPDQACVQSVPTRPSYARILRLPDVLSRRGKSRTQHYNDVAAGLFTRPVKLSERAAGWPESECEALVRAVIAGRSDEQIKALVSELEIARGN